MLAERLDSLQWEKICPSCKIAYRAGLAAGLAKFFGKNRAQKDGYQTLCRACRSEAASTAIADRRGPQRFVLIYGRGLGERFYTASKRELVHRMLAKGWQVFVCLVPEGATEQALDELPVYRWGRWKQPYGTLQQFKNAAEYEYTPYDWSQWSDSSHLSLRLHFMR